MIWASIIIGLLILFAGIFYFACRDINRFLNEMEERMRNED